MSDPGQQEAGGEEALVAARRAKAERVRDRGESPFANDVAEEDRTTVAELRALCADALLEPRAELRYDPERVAGIAGERSFHLVGRMVARRGFGKASFLRLRDGSGELQVFAKKDVLGDGFAALEDIDIADHIEARGTLMVTRTGELSLQAKSLALADQGAPPAARQVARSDRRGRALPAPLRRYGRQPGRRRRAARALVHRPGAARLPRPARLPRGRDADPAHAGGRRRGEAVRHPPQHARHASFSCASRRSCTSSACSSAASSASTRSAAATATRASAPGTTPSSRCSSSTRRTPRTRR